jgi:hypothetical protein
MRGIRKVLALWYLQEDKDVSNIRLPELSFTITAFGNGPELARAFPGEQALGKSPDKSRPVHHCRRWLLRSGVPAIILLPLLFSLSVVSPAASAPMLAA